MPKLSDPPPAGTPLVKMFLIGDSKSGKTAALAGLVRAGYTLGILDMDCKINPSYFQQSLRHENAALLSRVSFMQFRDEYENNQERGTAPKIPALAYNRALRATDKWEDGTAPKAWGPEHVFVVDTLNTLSVAAFNQAYAMAPKTKDPRQWYKSAQNAIEAYVAGLWAETFATNVIIISHITDIELEFTINSKGEKEATLTKGFPTTIGQALSKAIAKYTNELFQAERTGFGPTEKRVIRTKSTGRLDLGTAALDLPKELPNNTGLATIFETLRTVR